MAVAWRKVCDEELCEGIFGGKVKQTTTTTTRTDAATEDPSVGNCDLELQYVANVTRAFWLKFAHLSRMFTRELCQIAPMLFWEKPHPLFAAL